MVSPAVPGVMRPKAMAACLRSGDLWHAEKPDGCRSSDAGAASDVLALRDEDQARRVAEHELLLLLRPRCGARQHFVKDVLRDHSLRPLARSRIFSRYLSFIALATFATRAFPR